MTDTQITPHHNLNGNPAEAARFLAAFSECSHEIQHIVLEMVAIISDPQSTEDERSVAGDAMMSALFPGLMADVLELERKALSDPEAVQASSAIRSENANFANRVRGLMEEKGIKQEILADLAGVGQSAISNLLTRNCRPQRRTVERIATALHVQPSEIWPEY